ncbi:MAG: hypothetical protein LBL90_01795 [Prevotellaceae bacterium]|jgi:hypothetical protein|nr:hypothetical protein [Prevotellaceae bacterium]
MKVSGFTIIRNAVKYDYPVVEAIKSILPLCDEMIVLIGNSEDDTLGLIESIGSGKIKIHHSVWDDSLRSGGRVLAVETNKAFDLVSADSDWAFYIQADEVIHEKYYDAIREAMVRYKDDKQVEGLLFHYTHFYGNYKYVGDSRDWYNHEIRMIHNDKQIRSYRDAQGFRKNGKKLHVKLIDAYVYHYGWVKDPYHQMEKRRAFVRLYDNGADNHPIIVKKEELYDYSYINSLTLFKGTHPQVMQQRINRMDWEFEHDLKRKKFNLKDHFLYKFEKWIGKRLFEYRNYKIIKD